MNETDRDKETTWSWRWRRRLAGSGKVSSALRKILSKLKAIFCVYKLLIHIILKKWIVFVNSKECYNMYCLTYVWHLHFLSTFSVSVQICNMHLVLICKPRSISVPFNCSSSSSSIDNNGLQFMGKSLASQDLLACYSNCYLLAVGDGRAAAPLSDSQSFS